MTPLTTPNLASLPGDGADRPARVPPQLLSDRVRRSASSAIRDLLDHAKRPGMISLAGGLPDASMFPTDELAEIARAVIADRGAQVLQYGPTAGDENVQRGLARLFTSSSRVANTPDSTPGSVGPNPASIVVTAGSQQALDLIARCVIDQGDHVVVGDADYLGALQAFRAYKGELCPIRVGADGLDTEQLEHQLRSGLRPRLCYFVPNFHNPTGAVMSDARRAHLANLSAHYGFLVVEDDPYRELFYGDNRVADYGGDPELTVRLRSTSKTLAPGLRIGVLAGPSWLTQAVVKTKQSTDLHTSSLSQAIVAEAVGSRWYERHVQQLRAAYGHKRDVFVRALAATFGDDISFVSPAGGMFVWARFAAVPDTSAWLQACMTRGVCFVPGAEFSVGADHKRFARLSFATSSADDLVAAVERLHGAPLRRSATDPVTQR